MQGHAKADMFYGFKYYAKLEIDARSCCFQVICNGSEIEPVSSIARKISFCENGLTLVTKKWNTKRKAIVKLVVGITSCSKRQFSDATLAGHFIFLD